MGAVLFSIIGALYIMGRGKGKFAPRFIPRLKEEELPPSLGGTGAAGAHPPEDDSPQEEQSQEGCAFCRIVQDQSLCYKIYEGRLHFGIFGHRRGRGGPYPGNSQSSCRFHEGLRRGNRLQLAGTVRLIADHYVESCGFDGVNILCASGKKRPAVGAHLHFHIIPERKGNGLNAWPALGKDSHSLEEPPSGSVCPRRKTPSVSLLYHTNILKTQRRILAMNTTVNTKQAPFRALGARTGKPPSSGRPLRQPPVGDLRFRRPQEHQPGKALWTAHRFSPRCPQADLTAMDFYKQGILRTTWFPRKARTACI